MTGFHRSALFGRHRTIGLGLVLVLVLALTPAQPLRAQEAPPTPEQALGYLPGADYKLPNWDEVVDYYQDVADASDRVELVRIGTSTRGRPMFVAIISAAETIADLEDTRRGQEQLADPRTIPDAETERRLIQETKPAVLITCTIHSSETASTPMSMRLLHRLATADDPATREILDGTVVLLVPSVNPDGIDIVANWYRRTIGMPWEGSGLNELYHPYAGHDTNRDWFMLNLPETRALTEFLYHRWFPTITWDVHQMGSRGARIFVPPFYDPVNPNLHPKVAQGIMLIGAHMAAELARHGKQGVLTNAMYDNWWNGGCRTVPQRHNMVGILTESASVKLATPIFLDDSDLRGARRGFPNHDIAVNFPDPWPGGWWRLNDIVEYQLICAESLLTLAARYRTMFQENYVAMGREAIERGASEPPYGWIIPRDQDDPGRAIALIRKLQATGIEVHEAIEPITLAGLTYPAGSWVLPADQPYRPYLKDVMERQEYPDRRDASGRAEAPYDVAGWTMPLQMGVEAVTITAPTEVVSQPIGRLEVPDGEILGPDSESVTRFAIPNRGNAVFTLLSRLDGVGLDITTDPERSGFLLEREPGTREALVQALRGLPLSVHALENGATSDDLAWVEQATEPVAVARIGVYQPWRPSMDEGWTRFTLDSHEIPYTTLHNAEVRAGRLAERFDVVVIPSIGANTLRNGYGTNETEPQYVGGLGRDGANALRKFVEQGGRLICLEDSSDYAIETFDLAITDPLDGLGSDTFFCPGSILGARLVDPAADTSENEDGPEPEMATEISEEQADSEPTTSDSPAERLIASMPSEFSLYFARSRSFGAEDGAVPGMEVLVRYAERDVLESGWLLGEEYIAGTPALARVPVGEGELVLFGFPPQHRGQPQGTFRLLFNGLLDDDVATDEAP